MILKELSFSFRWDNLEAMVEWLHALPDRGTIFAAIETSMLKEAALEAFQSVFSEMPLTQSALEHSGFGTPFYGLLVMYFSIAHPAGHLSVLFAATLRERVGKLTKFDLNEVRPDDEFVG